MGKRGRPKTGTGHVIYAPELFINEVNDIKQENKLVTNNDALRKIVEYSKVGREAERIYHFNFFKKRRGGK